MSFPRPANGYQRLELRPEVAADQPAESDDLAAVAEGDSEQAIAVSLQTADHELEAGWRSSSVSDAVDLRLDLGIAHDLEVDLLLRWREGSEDKARSLELHTFGHGYS